MFGLCKDDLARELHKKGYSVIALPEASVHARQVLGRYQASLHRFGDLDEIFGSDEVSSPEIIPDTSAAPIDVTQSGLLDSRLGAAILGRWLGKAKANAAGRMRQAHKFKLKINDVSKEYIDLAPTDAFLATAYLRIETPTIERLIDVDSLYLITSVLTATSMTLESETGDVFQTQIQADEVSSGVSGSIKMSTDGKNLNKVVFKAEKPVAFAFQAAKMMYEDGNYVCLHPERDNLTLMSKGVDPHEGWLCDEIGFDILRVT
jgi:hypothetical protein